MDTASRGAAFSNPNEGGGITSLLQRALLERINAVCQSSTDDGDSDYNDWDDKMPSLNRGLPQENSFVWSHPSEILDNVIVLKT